MRKRLLFTLFAILFCSTTFGQKPNWEAPNSGAFQGNMTVSAYFKIYGEEQFNQNIEFAAFCGNELRGVGSKPVEVTLDGEKHYLSVMTVHGNANDIIKFKIWDPVLEEVLGTLEEKNFYLNDIVGPIAMDFYQEYWDFTRDVNEIPQSMTIISQIAIDDNVVIRPNLEVAAFHGDELRGIGRYDEIDNNMIYFTIYGNNEETENITFKLYDHNDGTLITESDYSKPFKADDVLGDYFNPEIINFITASYVAQIGENKYTTFEKAYEAAQDNDDIILLENITLEENPTVVSKDININLNSKTVSGTIKLAHTGATVTGVAEAMTVTSGVEGYIVVCENNVYSLSERQPSGKVAYRAYINDSESREAVQVDLTNVYAKTSFVVELLDANDNVLTTTSLKAGKVNAESYTCNIVLEGTASGSWDTEIKASKLTVANIPTTIKVYADGTSVDTYYNALGAGTNVDETEKYKALDCVYKEAKIGETLYATFAAALTAAVDDNEIILLANVDFAETTVSKDININLNNNTVTGTIVLANTDATVTCTEGAVTVKTNVAGYKVVYEDGMYKLVAKNYVAQVGDVKYESIQEAVDAAQAGNEIVVIADINNETVEVVEVNKNVIISGSVTLNNVSINAVEGANELTVSGLSFTGDSWINSGTAEKLTVSGVTANVTPSNTAYTNSRSAFISLGRSEQQQLELYVTGCNIVANGGGDAILGWAAITTATLTGNTFGSETAYQTNSDCVKFMAIAQGAVFNITGNTIYSNYNGIVFGQNTTRDNAYTVNVDGNTFKGSADHIWIEVSGSNTTHATVKATSNNTVNGNEFTANDIKLHPNLNTFTSYAGVDVVLDVNGKVLGGTFKYVADGVIADGYKSSENADGTYSIVEKLSGEIAYRAYVTDTESVEAVSVDLSNVYASSSLKVELYNVKGDVEELLVTTTYAKTNFPIDANSFTCFMVLSGTPDEYWSTTINAEELTIENLPTVIKLYVDGELVDTFDNALGAETNVDETEDYKALDCVYKEASITRNGTTEYYMTLEAALAAAQSGDEVVLHNDVLVSGKQTITTAITINGNNHSIKADETAVWYTTGNPPLNLKQYKTHLLGLNSDNITLKNIVLDCNDNAAGINLYCAQNVTFDNVEIINATKGVAALTVNGSTLTVKTKLVAKGNAVAIDIDNGSGVTSPLGLTVAEGTVFDLENKTVKFDSVADNDVTNAIDGEGKPYFAAMDNAYFYTLAQMEVRTDPYKNGLTLLADVTLDDIELSGGTLNLNGKTLTLNSGMDVSGAIAISGDNVVGTITLTKANASITTENTNLNVITTVEGATVVYSDGKYSVVNFVAKVGEEPSTYYTTLSVAFAAAQEGETITMLADVTEEFDINNTANVTFDMNGFTLTGAIKPSTANLTIKNGKIVNTNVNNSAIEINAGSLTLNNDVVIKSARHALRIDGNVAVTINGGEYKAAIGNGTGTYHALNVSGTAVVTIVDGTFVGPKGTTADSGAAVNVQTGATVSISGGNFSGGKNNTLVSKGVLTLTGGTYDQDVNVFCADGYGAVETTNGVWEVIPLQVQLVTLEERWNWVSHYVVGNTDSDILTQLKNGLGAYGVQIKNQFYFTNYDTEDQSWSGSLSATSVTDMYKVNTSLTSGETLPIQLAGTVVNPASHPIELAVNWNYIGYPLNEGVSVGTVFANVAKDGDYVKSQDAFAEYYGGTWHGNLKTMKPGEGYMYRNISLENVDVTKTLVYSYPNAKEATEANITSENNYWVPASSQYAGNMTMVAMLDVKGGDYEVAAFVGGEVRGSSRPVYIESLDAYMFFLTIHGDEVAEMTFKVYDLATGEEYSIDNRMNYSDDAVVGSVRNPYMLTCSTLAVGENNISNISIYPNPTTTGNEINLGTECDTVEVFNALGVKVAEYQNVDTVDALETAGIYVIRITNDGNVQNCRLIVK